MRVLYIKHDHCSPTGSVGERFAERGYDGTSIRTIVAKAGLKPI